MGQCGKGESNCCGPTEYTKVSVNCSSQTLTYDVITACGCDECLPLELYVRGTVVSNDNTSEPVANVEVSFAGETVSTTDDEGLFNFTVTEELERISLTVTPPVGAGFIAVTQTLTISKGTSGVITTTVKLLTKAPADEINSTEASSCPVTSGGVDMGNINIPANSFYTESGEPVTVSLFQQLMFVVSSVRIKQHRFCFTDATVRHQHNMTSRSLQE